MKPNAMQRAMAEAEFERLRVLPAAVRNHNIEMMRREPAPPRVVGPWHSASVHDDSCRCERCRALHVNACVPRPE